MLSVGYIAGGSPEARNVVPSELVIAGTARSYSPDVRVLLERRLSELAQHTAAAWGCQAEASYERGPSALVNRPEQTEAALAAAATVAGADHVNGHAVPNHRRGGFCRNDAGPSGRVHADRQRRNGVEPDGSFNAPHTPGYNFNDAIIPDGVAYWVSLVQQELGAELS